MKKTALVLAVIILATTALTTASAIDTRYRSGTITTVKHFSIFEPYTNELANGNPLVIFFASSEQPTMEQVLGFMNKYHLYEDAVINLMCVSFAGTFSLPGWAAVAEELAEYLQPEYGKQPFDIMIDCAGNGGYGGYCLAQELASRGMIPRELNLGDGAAPGLVTSDGIRSIAGNGTQVNLYASSSDSAGISVCSREMIEELAGTERFHGEIIREAKHNEVLWKAVSEYGLHSEYTCWDVMELQHYEARNGITVHYCAYIPEAKETRTEWPILLYFHGIQDTLGKLHGLGELLRTDQIKPNGIVILPQALYGTDEVFHTKAYQDAVIELAGDIAAKYRGDLNRLSVSGHSDGGTTAYQIVNGHPGVFAACAPISGVGNTGDGIKQTYLWVFQGAKDYWVKLNIGLRVVLKCESSGCHAMHFVYENEGHEIQTMVFQDTFTDENGDEVRLIDWLMSKTLNP